jgi:predicted GNAT family N-acyltransferase
VKSLQTQVSVFYADRKSKMATITGHRLTLDPMGKCSNAFFSETTNMIKAKLYMNVHNIYVQFGFNHICSFWEEGIWTFSHRVQC